MICSQTAQLTVLASVVVADAVFNDFLGLDVPFVEDFAEVDVDVDVDVGEPAEVSALRPYRRHLTILSSLC